LDICLNIFGCFFEQFQIKKKFNLVQLRSSNESFVQKLKEASIANTQAQTIHTNYVQCAETEFFTLKTDHDKLLAAFNTRTNFVISFIVKFFIQWFNLL